MRSGSTSAPIHGLSFATAALALERSGDDGDEAPRGEVIHPSEDRAESYRVAREGQQRLYEALT